MTAVVKYAGIEQELGGKTYVIPPISLRALEQLKPKLDKLDLDSGDLQGVGVITEVLYCALKRNYQEITLDEVGDMIDVGNMFELLELVMDVSGLKRKALLAEKAGAPGEGKPSRK